MSRIGRVAEAGAGALAGRLPRWRGVLVLGYHRIGDPSGSPYDRDLYSTTAAGFERQLDRLAAHADVIAPSDVETAASLGPGRRVAITFDDCYRDVFEHAVPALAARGLPAAFFVPTGFIDRPRIAWWDEIAWMAGNATATSVPAGRWLASPVPLASPGTAASTLTDLYKRLPGEEAGDFLEHLGEATGAGRAPHEGAADMWMTWDMLRDMRDRGMEIGGHTVDHPLLSRVGPEAQRREIEGCLQRLEEELGERPTQFAYPVGGADHFDAISRAELERAGVRAAYTLSGGYVHGSRVDRLALPRAAVHHSLSDRRVLARVARPATFARW